MDHERINDVDKMVDEIMLPGFRFHPTDEELVGFYLKRKVQQRPLSIELIKQLDIYKYDPWDLPKMATTGEKEWYFYCPRDRKYRNSARPNRVTGAGFWKATGTDRPIYSSEGNKCIGLKKSLVFYKGRAAKGIKTDWMMHEFRLPSLTDSVATKRFIDNKNIPINDSWAICRIFKKTNSTAQRTLSHSWVSPLPEPAISVETVKSGSQMTQLSSQNMLLHYNNQIQQQQQQQQQQQAQSSSSSFSPLDFFDKPAAGIINPMASKSSSSPPLLPISNGGDLPSNIFFSSLDHQTLLSPSMMFNLSSSIPGEDYGSNGYSLLLPSTSSSLPQLMQGSFGDSIGDLGCSATRVDDHWVDGLREGMGLSFNLPTMGVGVGVGVGDHGFSSWSIKPNNNNLIWDSNSPCPSDQMSTSLISTTTNCFT